MNKIILLISAVFIFGSTFAQDINSVNRKLLRQKEDSLKDYALAIVQGRTAEERFAADSQFTKMFVRALKIKGSFHYPFDSLITISKLSPADSSFKIYTWQLVINDNLARQHGAIQMKTPDGSLRLFPLIDKTSTIHAPEDTITNNFGWVGAVYYKLITKKAFGKNYYTLLGYDENNLNSNKKIIEVLTFKNEEPVFGGPNFSFQDNSLQKKSIARYIMEYKRDASPRLTFDAEQDMIIYEHLISETGEPNKKYTYIPDGDYEGLKWKDGKWVHIQKVFTLKTPEGQEPVPHPIRDAQGVIDESKLSQRMPENTNGGNHTSDETEQTSSPKSPVKKKK
ncbi:MAG: hypothetical protein ABIN04_16065 [Ginsengibacter sp.]